MGGRNFKSSGNFPYGFNGKLKVDEISGDGNNVDFGARMLDTRLGRWLSLDPLSNKYPGLSPYNYVANNPVIFIDPDGKRIKPARDGDKIEIEKVFDSFNDKKGNKVDGQNLFGISPSTFIQKPGDKESIITIYATNLTQEDFQDNLKKAKLSDKDKKAAQAVFDKLSATGVYEIAVIDAGSQATGFGTGKSDVIKSTSKAKVITENSNSDKIFATLQDPEKTMSDKDQVINEELGSNGSNYFPNTGSNESVIGIIIIKRVQEVQSTKKGTESEQKSAKKEASKATTERVKTGTQTAQ